MQIMTGMGNPNRVTLSLKKADGTVVGTVSYTKPDSKKYKYKRLQYNFKEISSQLLRAKTSGSARQVISRARSVSAMLRKKLKTDEYDAKELESAILHAEQMEKIAKKRVKHLEEEESAKRGRGPCQAELEEEEEEFNPEDIVDFELSSEEMRELMKELQEAMEESMEEWEEESGLEEISGKVRKDIDPEDLKLLKQKHRSDELRDIMKTDMKYLKALFDKLEKERQQASSGVSMQLSGMEVPVEPSQPPVTAEGGNIDVQV